MAVALPVGLPVGADLESAISKAVNVDQALPIAGSLSWTVPGGELWLVQTASALYGASAVAGNRELILEIDDANGNVVWMAVSPTSAIISANGVTQCTGTLAGQDGGITGTVAQQGGIHVGLPWLVLSPGYQLLMSVNNSDVGDRWQNVGTLANVTAWDWGSSGGGGGTGGTIAVGPALYVPGPMFDTEAA